MKKLLCIFTVLFLVKSSYCQSVSFDELVSYLSLNTKDIDTKLKIKNYHISNTTIDGSDTIFTYSIGLHEQIYIGGGQTNSKGEFLKSVIYQTDKSVYIETFFTQMKYAELSQGGVKDEKDKTRYLMNSTYFNVMLTIGKSEGDWHSLMVIRRYP